MKKEAPLEATYREVLTRNRRRLYSEVEKQIVLFSLDPSTTDEDADDVTSRRVIAFAEREDGTRLTR